MLNREVSTEGDPLMSGIKNPSVAVGMLYTVWPQAVFCPIHITCSVRRLHGSYDVGVRVERTVLRSHDLSVLYTEPQVCNSVQFIETL